MTENIKISDAIEYEELLGAFTSREESLDNTWHLLNDDGTIHDRSKELRETVNLFIESRDKIKEILKK